MLPIFNISLIFDWTRRRAWCERGFRVRELGFTTLAGEMSHRNNNELDELFCGFLFQDFGSRISQVSGDSREASYLLQCIAVTTERFNSVLFRDSFVAQDDSDAYHSSF